MTTMNILSVDLEDWFHICGVERHLPASHWDTLESRVDTNTRIISIFWHSGKSKQPFSFSAMLPIAIRISSAPLPIRGMKLPCTATAINRFTG